MLSSCGVKICSNWSKKKSLPSPWFEKCRNRELTVSRSNVVLRFITVFSSFAQTSG